MAFSYLLRVDNPTDLSEATEALEPLVLDTTTQRLQQWADQARQESGADALRDLDSVPNLLDLTGAHPPSSMGDARLVYLRCCVINPHSVLPCVPPLRFWNPKSKPLWRATGFIRLTW